MEGQTVMKKITLDPLGAGVLRRTSGAWKNQ